jgi:hypothetical protein
VKHGAISVEPSTHLNQLKPILRHAQVGRVDRMENKARAVESARMYKLVGGGCSAVTMAICPTDNAVSACT